MSPKVIVIERLIRAVLLGQARHDVTVLEANTYPGGCAGTFYHRGYRLNITWVVHLPGRRVEFSRDNRESFWSEQVATVDLLSEPILNPIESCLPGFKDSVALQPVDTPVTYSYFPSQSTAAVKL